MREPGQPIKGSGTCASPLETPEAPIRNRAKSWDKVNIYSPAVFSFPLRNISVANAKWKNLNTSSGLGALLNMMVLTNISAPAHDVEALIPRLWKEHFAATPLRSDLDHAH